MSNLRPKTGSSMRTTLLSTMLLAVSAFAAHAQSAAPPHPQAAPAAAPLATTTPAGAIDGKRGRGGFRIGQACKIDLATHCATIEKGRGARVKCLIDNKAKLTPDCATALETQAATRQAQKLACATEIQTLCGDARGPARRSCMEANASKISPECATRHEKRADRRAARADAANTPSQTAPVMSPTPLTPKHQ